MVETPNTDRRDVTANDSSGAERALEVEAWFVREVLPLEAVLIQFLNRSGRSKADVEDLRQDVYMRVCAAAYKEIPNPTRPLVFTIARNLLIDQVRHEQVVPIDAVENLDVLIVDPLQYRYHSSHLSLSQALEWIERLKPKRAILTHMHVPLDYDTVQKETPDHVEPAFDGLRFEIDVSDAQAK